MNANQIDPVLVALSTPPSTTIFVATKGILLQVQNKYVGSHAFELQRFSKCIPQAAINRDNVTGVASSRANAKLNRWMQILQANLADT